jgi:hypothetical protein
MLSSENLSFPRLNILAPHSISLPQGARGLTTLIIESGFGTFCQARFVTKVPKTASKKYFSCEKYGGDLRFKKYDLRI